MADTLTKKKAPAKPKKTATKKETVAPQVKPAIVKPAMPSREQVEQLAKRYWAERDYQDGYAEQDWLRAEQELLKKAS